MPERHAVVAYSFGGSPGRPGKSNEAFGRVISRTRRQYPQARLIVQDCIAECLAVPPDLIISEHRNPGQFLDTEEVTHQAALYLKQKSIVQVLLVAHPFFHWIKCKRLLEVHGFTVRRVKTGWVPFDPDSSGWWVRGPFHLLWYSVLQKTTGRSGF